MDPSLKSQPQPGRGAVSNPPNRFEVLHLEVDEEFVPEPGSIKTQYFRDHSSSILAHNESPDVGFDTSINAYRGCEHGCVYCFARPTHEYLGYSAGLDFESKIFIKEDAPELLRKALSSKRWNPRVVAMSGVTDCYQPIEKKLELTRKCLEVFREFRNPVVIITKNHLVTRDIDILQDLASRDGVAVYISVTTLDDLLARKMEPRTSTPQWRLSAIRELSSRGIQVGTLVAPIVPGLTDHEVLPILEKTKEAGAQFAGYTVLRLPHGLKTMFEEWLKVHYPDRARKVLDQIRSVRDGKLYDSDYGTRMKGTGIFAEQIASMFKVGCIRAGIWGVQPTLSTGYFRSGSQEQLDLPL